MPGPPLTPALDRGSTREEGRSSRGRCITGGGLSFAAAVASTEPKTKPRRRVRGALTAVRSKLGRPPAGQPEARRRWSVLRRRKWLILQAIVLVPAIAV